MMIEKTFILDKTVDGFARLTYGINRNRVGSYLEISMLDISNALKKLQCLE